MRNYNTQLQSHNADIQEIITLLQNATVGNGGEQTTPIISVNSSGLITATAGTKSSTHQLAFQPAKTITPGTASQIAVSSGYYTGGNVTVAGDSNLVAENIKNGVSIFGVSGTLEEGSSSGEAAEWSENEDAIISRTITNYTNDRVKAIGNYAFERCYNLTNVSFPVCTTIGSNAFYSCSSLTSINFPVCTFIGSYAFYYCSSLTSINFPVCTFIGSDAFYSCRSLTNVSFPVCTTIGSNAFNCCYSLTNVSFPVCTTIGNYAFSRCSNLTNINFPVCTTIGSDAFYSCSSLTSINFPVCTTIGNYAFERCSSLTSINFPVCTTIGNYAFANCYLLSSLTLSTSTICTLRNSDAFTSTPYAGYSSYFSGTPYIYVPASLIDAYRSATNWVYFSSYFSTIESLDSGNEDTDIITFTVDNTEYQAENGMTWIEWILSDYNIDGYVCQAIAVYNGSGLRVLNAYRDEAIIANKNYSVDYFEEPPSP